MKKIIYAAHEAAALTFACAVIIDYDLRASTLGTKQTIHNRNAYLNNALMMSPNPNAVRRYTRL